MRAGKQLGFFADDSDLHEFLQFAEEREFLAIPDLIETDMEAKGVPPTQMTMTGESGEHCFHLLPPGVASAEAFYREVEDKPGVSRLMKNVSPVTEVRPCPRHGSELADGRIHFNMDRQVSQFKAGEKGYERLAQFLRKWTKTRQYRFHVGPHTVKDVLAGRIKLVHWNEELNVA